MTTNCCLCDAPIDSLNDSVIFNNKWDINTADLSPYMFGHGECLVSAESDGDRRAFLYDFTLDRIVDETGDHESLFDWQRHLREKNWFLFDMYDGLQEAHELAKTLHNKSQPSHV